VIELVRSIKKYRKELIEKLYDELRNFKQEKEDLKREIHELRGDGKKEHKELEKILNADIRDKDKRSYSEVMKKNKKENIILV